MDGHGRALDNVFTERLSHTIKYEEVYLHEYASPKEAYRQLADYIRFYNFQRPHQPLDYLSPANAWDLQDPDTCDRLNLNKSLRLKLTLFQL